MDFNNYLSNMESAEGEEVYLQLQTVYTENAVLLQYFESVNKQFLYWLDVKPFNAVVIAAILPKLEPILSSLATLKFNIADLEDEDFAFEIIAKLMRLKRNITTIMTYQEMSLYQTRIEQLIKQNHIWQLEKSKIVEREQKENQHTLAEEDIDDDFMSIPWLCD